MSVNPPGEPGEPHSAADGARAIGVVAQRTGILPAEEEIGGIRKSPELETEVLRGMNEARLSPSGHTSQEREQG